MSPGAKPIPNSYWLPGGRVAAGEYPGDRDEAKAREKIAALLDAGVTAFIDLTSDADGMASYEPVLADEARQRGVTATRVSLPVRDMDVPSVLGALAGVPKDKLLSRPYSPVPRLWCDDARRRARAAQSGLGVEQGKVPVVDENPVPPSPCGLARDAFVDESRERLVGRRDR
jgi:hypothetical protein